MKSGRCTDEIPGSRVNTHLPAVNIAVMETANKKRGRRASSFGHGRSTIRRRALLVRRSAARRMLAGGYGRRDVDRTCVRHDAGRRAWDRPGGGVLDHGRSPSSEEVPQAAAGRRRCLSERHSMVRRRVCAPTFFGSTSSSTPSLNRALARDSSISCPSWKLRVTLPK